MPSLFRTVLSFSYWQPYISLATDITINAQRQIGQGSNITDTSIFSERCLFSKAELCRFLTSFVEQSPPPQYDGLRRVVREYDTSEKFLGMVHIDTQVRKSKCVMYPDQPTTWLHDYSFLNITFLGIEHELLLHDIMTYNVVDLLFDSPSLSIFMTYLMHLLRKFMCHHFGLMNIEKKYLWTNDLWNNKYQHSWSYDGIIIMPPEVCILIIITHHST